MTARDRDQPNSSYPRLHSYLRTPDDDAWRHRRHYIPRLADALRYTYAVLHAAPRQVDAYFYAYAALIPFRDKIMCAEQRLRTEYALTLAYTGESAVPQALAAIDRALEAAEELQDEVALVELTYLAGALAHSYSLHNQAFGHYSDALEALQALQSEGVVADPMLELDLTLRLGWRACEIGRFSQGLHYLDQAYALRAQWPATSPSQAAWLSWLDAHLAHAVRRNPAQALALARPAATLLLENGQPLNAGRALVFVAECAIDLARSPSARDDPQGALKLGRDAAQQARVLARETDDAIGEQIAHLATLQASRVEMERLGTTDRSKSMPALERLLRTAERLNDMALIGRVETAMGDELAAQGDLETARILYLRARSHLTEHDLGGLAIWPGRALLQIGGM